MILLLFDVGGGGFSSAREERGSEVREAMARRLERKHILTVPPSTSHSEADTGQGWFFG